MKVSSGIYDCVMKQSQQHGRRGQRIDTRHPGRQSQKVRLCLGRLIADGESKLVVFFLAREFDGFHSLSLLVESKVSLCSC